MTSVANTDRAICEQQLRQCFQIHGIDERRS
jgi:hypothetical protein